jgi:hypothetical protein
MALSLSTELFDEKADLAVDRAVDEAGRHLLCA